MTAAAVNHIELTIAGMTCASCAARIEKKLNRLDGVNATVNYATEKAAVTVPVRVRPAALIAEVEKAGYTAALPQQPRGTPPPRRRATDDPELTIASHPPDRRGRARRPRSSPWR